VGSRLPAQRAKAVASFHETWVTGSSGGAVVAGPSGWRQSAPSARVHSPRAVSNTPDQPNRSASVR